MGKLRSVRLTNGPLSIIWRFPARQEGTPEISLDGLINHGQSQPRNVDDDWRYLPIFPKSITTVGYFSPILWWYPHDWTTSQQPAFSQKSAAPGQLQPFASPANDLWEGTPREKWEMAWRVLQKLVSVDRLKNMIQWYSMDRLKSSPIFTVFFPGSSCETFPWSNFGMGCWIVVCTTLVQQMTSLFLWRVSPGGNQLGLIARRLALPQLWCSTAPFAKKNQHLVPFTDTDYSHDMLWRTITIRTNERSQVDFP